MLFRESVSPKKSTKIKAKTLNRLRKSHELIARPRKNGKEGEIADAGDGVMNPYGKCLKNAVTMKVTTLAHI